METQLAGLVSQCVFCRNGLFSNVCSVRHHFAILGQISGSKGPKVNDPAGFPWNGYCHCCVGCSAECIGTDGFADATRGICGLCFERQFLNCH